MKHFRIPTFTGIENHRQDTDRGTLRLCEGAVLGAVGSVRSAPRWDNVFPMVIPEVGSHVITAQDDEFNKYAFTSVDGIVNSTKIFTNENPVPSRLGDLIGMQHTVLTADTPAYINDVGSRRAIVGNGVDQKKITEGAGPLVVEDLSADIEDIYKLEVTPFPNCSMFVIGLNKCIYAAGNAENPLRVYVSEPTNTEDPLKEGIYSTQMSVVDILATNATKITALSTYQNYVVVHTDAGVVLLFQAETQQASTGFRVEQTTAAANSGAINPNCVAGSAIIQPYYLGVDGQVYKDSSARRGPENKPSFSDVEQVTAKAKGLWDKTVDRNIEGSFSAYETFSGLYNFYMPAQESEENGGGRFQGFYYSDIQNALAGPVLYPRLTSVTSVGDTSILLGVSENNQLLSCDMEQMKEARELESPLFDPWESPDNTDPGGMCVSFSPSGNSFNSNGRTYSSAMADSAPGNTIQTDPIYFENSYLSVIETSYEDLGGPHLVKQIHEIGLTFQGGSYGHVWVYAQGEGSLIKGRARGTLFGKEQIKTFMNLRSRRVRVRIYIASHVDYDWVLTDLSIGFLEGKTLT